MVPTREGFLRRARFYGTVALATVSILLLLPFHLAAVAIGGRTAMAVAPLWHRFVVRILGIRVTVTGSPVATRPLLLLSNHTSWLDITVLASIAPVSFIAKKEVAGWPIVGWLAKLQRSVFIDRERRHSVGAKAREVAGRLSKGDIIVLFAEGTSSDGNTVLPFRSALLGAAQHGIAAEGRTATVQPVAIAYTKMLGLPLGRQHRPLVAWYGGTDLLPHLRRLLSEGAIDVHVVFGPPRTLRKDEDRKIVAAEAGLLVRRVVAAINRGMAPAAALAAASGISNGGGDGGAFPVEDGSMMRSSVGETAIRSQLPR
jgi:1-acyl-sn-glycerol-3-phosphate acyltransferase